MTREWSHYQTAIFDDIARGTGHTVVQARAGSGKTTTIMEGLRHLPDDAEALLCAFNKRIAEELQRRAPRGKDIEVKTLHSLGFAAVRGASRGVRIDGDKGRTIARSVADRHPNLGRIAGRLGKLTGLAKNVLASTAEEIELLAVQHGVEDETVTGRELAPLVLECMRRSREELGSIDFDDMVWLPPTLNLRPPKFDFVLVDETQDLNASQLWLAKAAVKRGGRIVAVGDDRQAIYGFRGADEDAMGRMVQELSAKVLPLSVSYRCPTSVVALARHYVPDFEPAPGALAGEVLTAGPELLSDTRNGPRPGDFILSRANAPLMKLCIAFLQAGVPATVAGRDIGQGLVMLAERSRAHGVPEMVRWLEEHRRREHDRLVEADKEELFEEIADKIDALQAIASGCDLVSQVVDRIDGLFSDGDDQRRVVLSSTHKAKGLERRRVFLIHDTFLRRRRGAPVARAEQNLYYVGATRAQETLYCCGETGPVHSTGIWTPPAVQAPAVSAPPIPLDPQGATGELPW